MTPDVRNDVSRVKTHLTSGVVSARSRDRVDPRRAGRGPPRAAGSPAARGSSDRPGDGRDSGDGEGYGEGVYRDRRTERRDDCGVWTRRGIDRENF